jgi:hypothetical protein
MRSCWKSRWRNRFSLFAIRQISWAATVNVALLDLREHEAALKRCSKCAVPEGTLYS